MLLLDDTFVFGVNEVVGAGMTLSLPLIPGAPEPVAVEPGGFFGAIVDSLSVSYTHLTLPTNREV